MALFKDGEMRQKEKHLVFGASGLLGSAIVRELGTDSDILTPMHKEIDLTDYSSVLNFLRAYKPSRIYQAAGMVHGITGNIIKGSDMYTYNHTMDMNLLNAVNHVYDKDDVRVMMISSSCAYPVLTHPIKENEMFTGPPENTNKFYAMTKRCCMLLTEAYRMDGWDFRHVVPCSLYGKNDNYGDHGHVIPELIKKFTVAVKDNVDTVEILGTGKESREFMYSDCAARAILDIMEMDKGDQKYPINIGSIDEAININVLANIIAGYCRYNGNITTSGDVGGVPTRKVDSSYSRELIAEYDNVNLLNGLNLMVQDYYKTRGIVGIN